MIKNKKNDLELKQFIFDSSKLEEINEKQKNGFSLPRYMNPQFKNQVGVRGGGKIYAYTAEEDLEYIKCKIDLEYFANNYCKIKSEDGKIKQMQLRDYQYDVLTTYKNNRVINMSSRQSGKTITAAITMLHYCLFNNDKGVMIVANKADTVIEIIDKIKNIYKLLPFFLKGGIINQNTRSIVFENGCRIKSSARTKEPAIGFTIDFLYMDEFAHVPNTIARAYYKAVIPTVSSIKDSKIIITSTPNGANLFKELVVSSELPETHPDKGMYNVIRVYQYQVPDGKFEDDTIATRLDARLYYSNIELKKYNIKVNDVLKYLISLGYKTEIQEETKDNGVREYIRIYRDVNDDLTDIDHIRTLSFNDVSLVKIFQITNQKEQEIKLIGGIENFNQEYNLQFIAGSKRILSEVTTKRIDDRAYNYEYTDIDIINKKIKFFTDELKQAKDFDHSKRNDYYQFTSIDTSEGLGLDYSVFNLFRLMLKDIDWLKENKIKKLEDAFYLKQTGIFESNVLDPKSELAELFYLLHFKYLPPQKTKAILEINGPGATLLGSLPNAFGGNNEYGTYIFSKFKHKLDDKFSKIGLKVTRNKKEDVKNYLTVIESDTIYVDEQGTKDQMENFIKIESNSGNVTYKADSGNDDCVPPDTLIHTNVGIKKIIDVNVGDYVLTHTGKYQKVLKIGNRYAKYIYNIKSNGKLDLNVTSNHNILTYKKTEKNSNYKKPFFENDYQQLNIDNGLKTLNYYTTYKNNDETIDIDYIDLYNYCDKNKYILENENIVSIIKNNKNQINNKCNIIKNKLYLSNDILYLIGYFLAEGSFNDHQVIFASNKTEQYFRDKIKNIVNVLNIKTFEVINNKNLGANITCTCKSFTNFFKLFKKHKNKTIPDILKKLPTDKLKYILYGYLMGDSTLTSRGIVSASISEDISFFIYDIYLKLNMFPSIKKYNQPKNNKYKGLPYIYKVKINEYYKNIIINNINEYDINLLKNKTIKQYNISNHIKRNTFLKQHNNYILGSIKKINKIEYNNLVYNLEVENDNSYIANGNIVHNCVMTLVNLSKIINHIDYKNTCYTYYKELSKDIQIIIDNAINLEYNEQGLSYKKMSKAVYKSKSNNFNKNYKFKK